MSRPEQNTAPFFPFFCKYGDCMDYLQNKYKNDGFATWVKILRELSTRNYHFIDLTENRSVMLLASKCFITEEALLDIISILVEFKEIDSEIWNSHRTIWNQKFIDSLEPLYERRKNKCLTKEQLVVILRNKVDINAIKGDNNPQSKVKKSKVEETKVKNINIDGIYFFIGKDSFKSLPSNHFRTHESMKSFREVFVMQRLSKDLEKQQKELLKILEAFDKKYSCYSFTSDNHFKNALNKTQEIIQDGYTKKNTTSAAGRGYKEAL